MTANAGRRSPGVCQRVARLAIQWHMRAGQRKTSARVVPVGRVPGRRRMAGLAVGIESGLRMARINLGIVSLLMAGHTCGRRTDVAAGMTGNALQTCVRSGQGELGRAMVEAGWGPSRCRMTAQAVVVEVLQGVIRFGDGVEFRLMTREAVIRGRHIAGSMTGDAVDTGVRPRQRECRRRMVERTW